MRNSVSNESSLGLLDCVRDRLRRRVRDGDTRVRAGVRRDERQTARRGTCSE